MKEDFVCRMTIDDIRKIEPLIIGHEVIKLIGRKRFHLVLILQGDIRLRFDKNSSWDLVYYLRIQLDPAYGTYQERFM